MNSQDNDPKYLALKTRAKILYKTYQYGNVKVITKAPAQIRDCFGLINHNSYHKIPADVLEDAVNQIESYIKGL